MSQFGRPSATVSAGGWTPTGAATLHEATDETTLNASDYAESGLAPASDPMRLTLTGITTDPQTGAGHTITVVLGKDVAGGARIDALIELVDDSSGSDVVIVSHTEPDVGDGTNTVTINLTTAQANAIGSAAYAGGNLDLRVTANQV